MAIPRTARPATNSITATVTKLDLESGGYIFPSFEIGFAKDMLNKRQIFTIKIRLIIVHTISENNRQ